MADKSKTPLSSGFSLTSGNQSSKKPAVAPADFSSSEARRIALAAQGFDRARGTRRVGLNDLRRTIRKLGNRTPIVGAAYRETHAAPGPVAEALAAELKALAGWLELDAVAVEPRGDFAGPLAAAVRRLR
jgi:uncharacterized protein YcaQ